MLYPLISLCLAIVPFFICIGFGDGIRIPKEFLSIISFIAIFGVAVYFYTQKAFKNKWLLLFLAWCFISLLFTSYSIPLYLGTTILMMPSHMFAWKELFYITLAIMTIYTIAGAEGAQNILAIGHVKVDFRVYDLKWIANTIVIVLFVMSVYSIIQALGFDGIFRCTDYGTGWIAQSPFSFDKANTGSISHRTVGTIGNPTFLGCWIAMCLPFCLYVRKVFGYVTMALGILILALTYSTLAIIEALTGIIVYLLLFRHWKVLLCFLLTVVAVFYFSFSTLKSNEYFNPEGRMPVHKEAWNLLKENPLFGLGLGTFEHRIGEDPAVIAKLNNQNWRELHDEYGQVWFSLGLIGLMLVLGTMLSATIKFFRNFTTDGAVLFSSLASLFVMSLGLHMFRVPPTSFYAVIFIGLFYRTIGERK